MSFLQRDKVNSSNVNLHFAFEKEVRPIREIGLISIIARSHFSKNKSVFSTCRNYSYNNSGLDV